ncbi:hypothetical protein CYMTET_50871 [Cymbomonas tetramitiformis]|uniref:Polycystin cation channel PKD1/PKD2 domain-containing protein n=1 Tax=Cymbomonas tetramitiformis TaxID=36881 RepID=A0AAE0BM90_9CHLO|nr:hypothetical protein CYMTET_50871 [Cymbomonas tetramitiformis]
MCDIWQVYFYADPGSNTGYTLYHTGSDAATCFSAVTNYTSAADVDSTWTLSMTGVPSSSAGATLDWSLTGPDLVCNDVGCFLQFCGFAVDTYTLTGSISVFGVAAQQTSGLLYVINAPPPPHFRPAFTPRRLMPPPPPYHAPSPPPPPPADVYEVAATILLSKVEMSDMDNDEFATNMTTYFAADLMNMLEIFYSAGSVVASVTLQFAGTDYTSALNYYTSLSDQHDPPQLRYVSEGDLPPLQVVTELEYEEEDEAVGLALEVDVMPPVMILLGAPYVEVLVRETYIDAGAMAEDLRDGFVPVTVLGLLELSTIEATLPGAPLILQYTAMDHAGNLAVAVQREVTVVSPCTAPSYVCEEPITEYLCATCDEGLDGNVTCVCLAFLSSSYSISTYDVTEYAPAEDVTPPVIAMLPGDGVLALTTGGAWVYVHRVLLGSGPFEDPGATAWDNVQGDLTASITRVVDAAGNEAVVVRRRVYVYNPCGEVEVPCEDGGCSVSGLCVSLDFRATQELPVAAPPEIRLVGPAHIVLDPGSSYALCTLSTPLAAMCDHGAFSNNPLGDGDLTSMVMVCSSRVASVGLAGCSLEDVQAGEHVINFTVTSSSGMTSSVLRTVVVRETCARGEALCQDDVACSESGVCLGELGGVSTDFQTVDAPPTLTLVETAAAGSVVAVKQGHSYLPCATSELAESEGEVCDPGVTATDPEDGDLTAAVLACPPQSCLTGGSGNCQGHEYAVKGLQGCLNTSAAVGSLIEVEFLVFDNAIPPNQAFVTRTIDIIFPCERWEWLCDDGACSSIECGLRDQFLAIHVDPIPGYPWSLGTFWTPSSDSTIAQRRLHADEENGTLTNETPMAPPENETRADQIDGILDGLSRRHGELSAALAALTQQVAYPWMLPKQAEMSWEEGYSQQVDNVKLLTASMAELQANADSLITAAKNVASAAGDSVTALETAASATASGIDLSYATNLPDSADFMVDLLRQSPPPPTTIEAEVDECLLDHEQSVRTFTFTVSSEAITAIITAAPSRRLATVPSPAPLPLPPTRVREVDALLGSRMSASLAAEEVEAAPRRLLARGGGGGGKKSKSDKKETTGSGEALPALEAHAESGAVYLLGRDPILRYLGLEGSNRLIGGILVHAKRRKAVAPSQCTERFQNLNGRCLGEMTESRYGTDQAFNIYSSLYSDVDMGKYYDLSPESEYLSKPARSPMPFVARAEALNRAHGGRWRWFGSVFPSPAESLRYPVMVGNRIDQAHAAEMIVFLKDGGYQSDVDNVVEVGAEMIVYNDAEGVLMLCTLKWEMTSGSWKSFVHTKPMKLHEMVYWPWEGSSPKENMRCLVDWAVCLMTAYLLCKEFHKFAALVIAQSGQIVSRATRGGENGGAGIRPSMQRWKALWESKYWTMQVSEHDNEEDLSDGTLSGVKLIIMTQFLSVVFYVYLTGYLVANLRLEAGAGTLDNTYAEAHYTMPAKLSDTNSTAEVQPRWALPDDDAGLEAYVQMLGNTDRIAAVITISHLLRALPLVYLIVMLQQQFDFQKKVSLLSNTVKACAADMLNMILIILLYASIFGALTLTCFVDQIATSEDMEMEDVPMMMGMFAFLGDYGLCKTLLDSMLRLEMNAYTMILIISFVAFSLLLLMFTLGQFAMAIIGDAFTDEKEKAANFPTILNNVELIPMRMLRERLRPELFGADRHWPKVHIIRTAVLSLTKKQDKEKAFIVAQKQEAAIQQAKNAEDESRRSLVGMGSARNSAILGKDGFKWDRELVMMLHRRNLTLHEVDTAAFQAMQNEYLELRGEKQSEMALKQMQQDLLDNAQTQQEQMAQAISRQMQLCLRLEALGYSS